ncbi:protein PAM71-homolog, chloroplastic isoform X2 [Magnolia sinica]|uniref:protein PAM71-homolog, chloroplastic isoform X2 n=1 Tax=Magnolia sinica TaxID=86752 RepID=UPI0026596751|nr:protein PAM71-homolog, chloroplastic isoform X2 [Magnolia sinica]
MQKNARENPFIPTRTRGRPRKTRLLQTSHTGNFILSSSIRSSSLLCLQEFCQKRGLLCEEYVVIKLGKMQACNFHSRTLSKAKIPLLSFFHSSPCLSSRDWKNPRSLRFRDISRSNSLRVKVKAQASNVNIGAGGYEGGEENESSKTSVHNSDSKNLSESAKPLTRVPFPPSVAGVLLGCALAFSLAAFMTGGPSALLAAIAKSGFTAAFTLIFVSEIGDKVLMGSMGALSLMTVLSVVIGRIFRSVPAQFRTTVPIGEYAAVALLMFFGLKSIKNAWELPSDMAKSTKESPELGELVEAEELLKEKVAKRLTNPLEIIWKSFSLVFFAEWGDRSMLATIALGAAQSPWGVAGGAIAGHLVATTVAILGGAFLANYISEKLVGYLGGVLFLLFSVATLLGVF